MNAQLALKKANARIVKLQQDVEAGILSEEKAAKKLSKEFDKALYISMQLRVKIK